MIAGVMNLWGWNLVIRDNENSTGIIIHGENESDLVELKKLISRTTIKISIQVPLNIPGYSIPFQN
jgi:hypothetical protein